MNPAKFITTVLFTAAYTSSIWIMTNPELNKIAAIGFPACLLLFIGGILMLGLFMVWVLDNWKK